jgi:hypothetical protein
LWLTYEELRADAPAVILRVASFLRLTASAEQVARIAALSSFDRMRIVHEHGDGRAAAALRHAGEAGHFREGRAGGWVDHFTLEQRERFEAAMSVRLRGTGLERIYAPSVPVGGDGRAGELGGLASDD